MKTLCILGKMTGSNGGDKNRERGGRLWKLWWGSFGDMKARWRSNLPGARKEMEQSQDDKREEEVCLTVTVI